MNNNFFNNYFIENLNRLIECPISQQIMKRPVTASDGITYDLDSIEKYFSIFPESQQVKSPVTREFLKNRNLIPNICLKNLIEFIIVQGMLDLQDIKNYFEGNNKELFNLQCWALTCESFFSRLEWIWIMKRSGYTGKFEFIYFE